MQKYRFVQFLYRFVIHYTIAKCYICIINDELRQTNIQYMEV